MLKLYACLACGERLSNEGEVYRCPLCMKQYPVIEGIPVFDEGSSYYGEIGRYEMSQLIKSACDVGYESALKKFIRDPFVLRYALDEGRALWANLLPLTESTICLDVGCGWGTNTVPLARKVGYVAAVDTTFERVEFTDIRARQSGLTNIFSALASATKLPYPDSTFDLVVFNGVIEWLGAMDEKRPPFEIQMDALQEANRVLKPKGLIYIAIENRYSLRYILGTPDDHSYVRFTSLMPRWMSQRYYRFRRSKNYFMHTYSLPQYRRMLKASGFEKVKEYYPWPDYRNPREYTELQCRSILKSLKLKIKNEPFGSRRWAYFQLLRALSAAERRCRFCHSFVFIYQKNPSAPIGG